MNLWGAAPFLVAALLGGGTGAHTVTAGRTIQHGAAHPAATPAAAPTPSVAAASTPGPVLSQIGSSRQWKTTLLLNANTLACQHVASSYWLETTPSGQPISGTATSAWQAGAARKNGSSCGVTVTFKGVSGVPKTASLILDEAGASSSIPLTVSRHVTVLDYLWIPAITGAVVALLALIASLFAVSIYSPDGRRLNFRHRDFWARPILASGAWTLNDSWATNITTVISVIGTVLGTTTAVSAFFPGVAVDRFVIVNIIAGGIIAVSPLIFAICYAVWIGRNPGVTGDATLRLPMPTTLAATLHPAAAVTLPKGTTVLVAPGQTARFPADTGVYPVFATPVQLAAGQAELPAAAGHWPARFPDGAAVTLPRDAARRIGVAAGTRVTALPGAVARPAADAMAQLVPVADAPSVIIGVVSGAKITVPGGAIVTAPGGDGRPPRQVKPGHAILVPPGSYIGVAAGAAMSLPGDTNIAVQGESTLIIGGSARRLTISGDDLMPLSPQAALPQGAPGQAAPPQAGPAPAAPPQAAGTRDERFPYPVRISTAGGAEVSVTGTADFSLPRATVISAPLRPVSVLSKDRDLQVPQGSNMIAANLKLILASLAVTMFGIGAELGIIGVLALGLSEASTTGLVLMGIAMLAVAAGAIVYAATATRTLANPEPGSSMSATPGTSFTL
jgi:hypothetical protein